MSVATAKKTRCRGCKEVRYYGVEIVRGKPVCIKCVKNGVTVEPKQKLPPQKPGPKPRPPRAADYEICELISSDGFFHVRRKVNTTTACGREPKDLPLGFRQGPSALLTLRCDVACCPKCKETLQKMWSEG